MNRRDYFLACLNVHLTALASGTPAAARISLNEVAEIQFSAWRLPEEAIPMLDPARAALEFGRYHFGGDVPKPEWLAAWDESLTR